MRPRAVLNYAAWGSGLTFTVAGEPEPASLHVFTVNLFGGHMDGTCRWRLWLRCSRRTTAGCVNKRVDIAEWMCLRISVAARVTENR